MVEGLRQAEGDAESDGSDDGSVVNLFRTTLSRFEFRPSYIRASDAVFLEGKGGAEEEEEGRREEGEGMGEGKEELLGIEFLERENYAYYGHYQEQDEASGVDPTTSLRFVPPEDSPLGMWTLVVLHVKEKAAKRREGGGGGDWWVA